MATDLAPVLTALADPARRRVVQLLSDGPHRAGELAAASGISAPAMSRHLKVLLQAGGVADERPPGGARGGGFWLRPGAVEALGGWVGGVKGGGGGQAGPFQRA